MGMSDANKLRFYIDQAIMTRDYAALAAFEDRLAMIEESGSGFRQDDEGSPERCKPEQATWFSLFGAESKVNP
jgi:hypothetical protein